MNEHLKNLLLMRMQFAWFFLFSVNALCASLLSALAGTDWATSDLQTRIMIGIGVGGSWTNTIMALFSKAMSRVKEGESPFIDRQTEQTVIKKEVTSQVSVTTTPPASESP